LLTDTQTDRQTDSGENITSLVEITINAGTSSAGITTMKLVLLMRCV